MGSRWISSREDRALECFLIAERVIFAGHGGRNSSRTTNRCEYRICRQVRRTLTKSPDVLAQFNARLSQHQADVAVLRYGLELERAESGQRQYLKLVQLAVNTCSLQRG